MRRKCLTAALALSLLIALVCGSCFFHVRTASAGYDVYFLYPYPASDADGSAVESEKRTLPESTGEIGGLLSALLSGPESGSLTTPFPAGTRLLGWTQTGGTVTVDLSEAYGGLSGVDLTLADACVTLTLCQLKGVEEVYLTVEGRARPFRDQLLRPAELLRTNGPSSPREVHVELWFPTGEGLVTESRTLELAVGDDGATAAVQALLKGPETAGSGRTAPEGTTLLSLERSDGVAAVDLSAQWLDGAQTPERLSALVNTVAGLTDCGVTVLVEGEPLESWNGEKLEMPLKADAAIDK